MSSSYTSSSSSISYSSSSSTGGGEPIVSGFQSTHQSHTDPSGITTERATHQNIGEPVQEISRQSDAQGRALGGGGSVDQGRITGTSGPQVTDVTEQEAEKERNAKKYEEAMEDEYAKREGGA